MASPGTAPGAIPASIPQVPFAGRMSYCLIRCLQMVLAHQGHQYPVEWLECVSGEPFGFVYLRDGKSYFAVVGYEYHLAGQHLLRTLDFDFDFTSAGDDDTAALATLDNALREGPVALGMLDMGYLTYAPDHHVALGADHAIVALARRGDAMIVHDPAGYPAVSLPVTDLMEAWKRDVYTGTPYGIWRVGAQGHAPNEEATWDATLARAREVYTREDQSLGPDITLCYGPAAMRLLAADMRAQPERGLSALPYFGWRVSGQRCLDGASFLRERLPSAAAVRWEQCQVYGELQAASATDARSQLPDLLERLADLETRFIAELG